MSVRLRFSRVNCVLSMANFHASSAAEVFGNEGRTGVFVGKALSTPASGDLPQHSSHFPMLVLPFYLSLTSRSRKRVARSTAEHLSQHTQSLS